MTTVEAPRDTYQGTVREVTLGAGAAEGGTRTATVTVGGEKTLPFLSFEGEMPHPPAIAVEVNDTEPTGWSPAATGGRQGPGGLGPGRRRRRRRPPRSQAAQRPSGTR
jgi:hypothetical protein